VMSALIFPAASCICKRLTSVFRSLLFPAAHFTIGNGSELLVYDGATLRSLLYNRGYHAMFRLSPTSRTFEHEKVDSATVWGHTTGNSCCNMVENKHQVTW
jgi:hypothetical protein